MLATTVISDKAIAGYLPHEILQCIFNSCATLDVARCARVSKHWCESATTHLWKKVTLTFGEEAHNQASQKFIQNATQNNHNIPKIQSLQLMIYPDKTFLDVDDSESLKVNTSMWVAVHNVKGLIRSLHTLSELCIYVEDELSQEDITELHLLIDSLGVPMPTLRKFSLSAQFEHFLVNLFQKVFSCWPNLSEISLAGITFLQPTTPPEDEGDFDILRQLTSLELTNVSLSPAWFSFMTSKTHKLKRLVLEYCDRFECKKGLDMLHQNGLHLSTQGFSSLEELYLCGVSSTHGLEECICRLIEATPNLKSLTLQDLSDLSNTTLQTISQHLNLTECVISICFFVTGQIAPKPMSLKPRNIRRLKLFGLSLVDSQLAILLHNAPFLQILDLGRLPVLKGIDFTYPSSTSHPTLPTFPCLNILILQQMRCFQNAGLLLLTNQQSSTLSRLIIVNCPYIKDDAVCSVLRKSPYLKEAAFGKSVWITEVSLRCLSECCPRAKFLSWFYNVQ
jgi:hypothetical protein